MGFRAKALTIESSCREAPSTDDQVGLPGQPLFSNFGRLPYAPTTLRRVGSPPCIAEHMCVTFFCHWGSARQIVETLGHFRAVAPPKAHAGHGTPEGSATLESASATVLCPEGR